MADPILVQDSGQVRVQFEAVQPTNTTTTSGWISYHSKTGKQLLLLPCWTAKDPDFRSDLETQFDAANRSILTPTVFELDATDNSTFGITGRLAQTFQGGAGMPVVLRNATLPSTDQHSDGGALWVPPPHWHDKAAFLKHFGMVAAPIRWQMGQRQLGRIERISTMQQCECCRSQIGLFAHTC